MTARRLVLALATTTVAMLLPTAAAQAAGCATWWGPHTGNTAPAEAASGEWGEKANWSTDEVPENQTQVCITIPGTYTVTLSPYAAIHYAGDDGGAAETLTVGASSGTQTLRVLGESFDYEGDWYNGQTLGVADGVTVRPHGVLALEATEQDAPNFLGSPDGTPGGSVVLETDTSNQPGHPFVVEGTLTTATSSSKYEPAIHSHAWTSSGSLQVASGELKFYNEEPATSTGSITVAAGATFLQERGSTFDNEGPITNSGTTILTGSNSKGKWIQGSKGTISGNTVIIEGDGGLEETASSAPSPFEIATNGAAYLLGTIPRGQTITIADVNNSQTATVYLGYTTPLINEGTIHMDVPAGSTESSTELTEGSIVNKGTIYGTVEGAKARNDIDSVITNEPGGVIDAASGTLFDNREIINNGRVEILTGSTLEMVATKFVNGAGGTIAPQIASASAFGKLLLYSGGALEAGGTLAPTLAAGFTPTTGQEFDVIEGAPVNGTFASVSGGFSADYTHETASPAYVGVVYGTTTVGGTTGAKTTGGGKPSTQIGKKESRAQKLKKALKQCKREKSKKKRASCEKQAKKKYGPKKPAKKKPAKKKPAKKKKHAKKSKGKTKVLVIAPKSLSLAAGRSASLRRK